ncbi:hypothetical protein LA080_001584 [Diaporthe eres]|nr:hypothetical protein LA080_001584 [Diaporthe eres]
MARLLSRLRARLQRCHDRAIQADTNSLSRQDSRNRQLDHPPPYQLESPPAYARSPSPSTENLDTLRSRNPPRSASRESADRRPQPTGTLLGDCIAAADSVELGLFRATRESGRAMVAACTLQAVAAAASTSRSYPAFVAAVTYAEMLALIFAETPVLSLYNGEADEEAFRRRRRHAFATAIKAAVDTNTVNGGEPCNMNDLLPARLRSR